MMIVRSLVTGLEIVAVDPSSKPMENVTQRIDFAAMVPLQVHDLLHDGGSAFQNVHTLIIGGGRIADDDIRRIKDLRCRFFATYGMTETVSHVALQQLNDVDASPYFKALPGITFSLDARGCLTIHWPAFGGPIVTNDLVELVNNETFTWLGRWDNVINSGGRKIIPENLETAIAMALGQAGYNVRFFISSVPDARLGNKVIIVIEGDHTDHICSNLRTVLQSSLQSFEVPKEFFACPAFVETQTGKINRRATLALAISRNHSSD
jgi:O-succinylbenzoic acid--CoA ligase